MIITGCTLIGIKKGDVYKKHYEELIYLKKIIILLRGEIRYNCGEIGEAMENIALKLKEPYKMICTDVAREAKKREGRRFAEIWNEKFINKSICTELWNEDREELKELGENIGYLDLEMQLNYLDNYTENLDIKIKDTKELLRENVKLYKTMGIMAGIMLSVIII